MNDEDWVFLLVCAAVASGESEVIPIKQKVRKAMVAYEQLLQDLAHAVEE